jgi:hypothetical protein
VSTAFRGVLKQALVARGFPAEDLAGYVSRETLEIALRNRCLSGAAFGVRDLWVARCKSCRFAVPPMARSRQQSGGEEPDTGREPWHPRRGRNHPRARRPDRLDVNVQKPNDFAVELNGIEPSASRVRWQGDGRESKGFAGLERQETPGDVTERPILATCSRNGETRKRIVEPLEGALRKWLVGQDSRGLRKALVEILALLET